MLSNRFFVLVKRIIEASVNEDWPCMAASISYYAFFSVFPLLIGLVALMGAVVEPQLIQTILQSLLNQYVPVSAGLIDQTVGSALNARGTIGPIALLGLLWSALGLFSAIRKAVNKAWEAGNRTFIQQKLIELAMVAVVGVLFFLSLGATVAQQFIHAVELPILNYKPFASGLLWESITVLLPLLINIGLFYLVYRFLPNHRVRWSDVLPGAVIAGVLFELAKNVFAWYVHTLSSYQLIYNSLATVVVFLFWVYISAIILLLGAEISAQYTLLFGSKKPLLSREDETLS